MTCVSPHVSLQVEGIVESFATESTRMSLDQAVAFKVTGQHALQGEHLMANRAHKVSRGGGRAGTRLVMTCKKTTKTLE